MRRLALAAACALWAASTCAAADWHFGAYADGAYEGDFDHPDSHLFRGRGTTPKVDEPVLNMALLYVRKDPTDASPWGLELSPMAGKDALDYGFSNTSPPVDHGDALRHFYRANMSYLAPVGRGLTVQGGLFNSIIGEESLLAKDNFNYTRTWIADFSPYLMFGGNVSYPFSGATTAGACVINEYFHLSRSNALPAYGAFVSRKAAPDVTLKEALFAGPDQPQTSMTFWRTFSDSIVELTRGRFSAWSAYDVGSEKLAATGNRVFWMGGALAGRWQFDDRWAAALRPEFYWDKDGRLTGSRQLVKALTTTVEYKVPWKAMSLTARLEHRWDESTGPDGGFFTGGEDPSGAPRLARAHHMLIAALLWTFDGSIAK